ncbi:DUF6295 family protein [Actinomadura madurae]|uniref:DUF6295 family protein n=1 Tax=Actinomadura madurae TaxID=1993 RepID=UPI0020D1FE36|nr:DUF6295 family protein [Actinomadura madurae]MCP9948517.1 DUF6295 family protein [Actinomadura madurae]MCP9965296.1 DUF6295 family protein [Actinomadura madurae]MCP9977784.1 DUF6295 family protein [Actinomadura madurae]MCQ0010720.1 DUF6295 family protein [Actinomadura madurae]MCQ0013971.1 DUF6295 family protein [Actinomadura madurae]
MCTYQTVKVQLDGAAKGATGWFALTDGAVYVDHPYHACHEHTVNIDFTNPGDGPSARVAVELTEESALALVEAIQAALAAAPPGLASASASGSARRTGAA